MSWRFSGSAKPERRERLERSTPYPELVHALQRAPVVCFHADPKQRDRSYRRACFCLDAGVEVFDAFFNAASGYRGAYFQSPETGVAANRRLIDALSPALVEWAAGRDASTNRAWLIESLSLPTAKAWLAEDAVALCQYCAGGWSASYAAHLKILNGRWEHSTHVHAVWGRQAPELSKVRVLGGFVNQSHAEWVADHKRDRAQQIWEHGWT